MLLCYFYLCQRLVCPHHFLFLSKNQRNITDIPIHLLTCIGCMLNPCKFFMVYFPHHSIGAHQYFIKNAKHYWCTTIMSIRHCDIPVYCILAYLYITYIGFNHYFLTTIYLCGFYLLKVKLLCRFQKFFSKLLIL